MTWKLVVVCVGVLAWLYTALAGRHYYRGRWPFLVLFLGSMAAACAAVSNALAGIAAAAILLLPVVLRAAVRLMFRPQVEVMSLARVDGPVLTYQSERLRGGPATFYWGQQIVLGLVFIGCALSVVFSDHFQNSESYWSTWVAIKERLSPAPEARVGERVVLDGVAFTVERVERRDPDPRDRAAAGKKLVRVTATVEALAAPIDWHRYSPCAVRDDADRAVDRAYFADPSGRIGTSIARGQTIRTTATFRVPPDGAGLMLVYRPRFRDFRVRLE